MIKLGSGQDGRIVAEFLERKSHSSHYRTGSIGDLYMCLARKHKVPIRRIKAWVNEYKEQNRDADTER